MRRKILFGVILMVVFVISFFELYQVTLHNMVDNKKEPILFGATYVTLNNPFFEVIDEEMRNVIEAQGDIMLTMDPELSLEKQIHQIQYLIEQGVKVLIVNPVDSKRLIDVLKQAKQAGIIVIAVDTNVFDGNDFVDYTVVSNNYQAGQLCALDMMKEKKEAKILILTHEAAYSAAERIQGFKDAIKDKAGYQIVAEVECEGQLEKSMPLVVDIMEQGYQFDVVMALNDPAALGAIAANKTEVVEMKVVLMVSHGEYAEGLHDALKMFVGNRDDVVSIGLKLGEDVASLEVRIAGLCDSFNEADEFIILADLIGGSPLTTLMKCFVKRDYLKHSVILGGMNLAMDLNAVLMKENGLAQVKEIALNEASAAIKEMNCSSEDEEDI